MRMKRNHPYEMRRFRVAFHVAIAALKGQEIISEKTKDGQRFYRIMINNR